MSKVKKIKLLSERTSGVPPVIFIMIIIAGRGKETSGFFVAALEGIVVGTIAYDRKVTIVIAQSIILIL